MTALTPHIRVLRSEAEELLEQAVGLRQGERFDAAFIVLSIGHAKCCAANALEAEERALEERLSATEGALMRLVIIESPYAGNSEANLAYARRCMRDSLERGESPLASHLLYTQPGILDDHLPEERDLGIRAGLSWRKVAEAAVFYVDRGWSTGMKAAREHYVETGFPYELRWIEP